MIGKVILLLVIFRVAFIDGETQFELSFLQSSNKVVVTDFYYMLEYSVFRGANS